MESALKGEERPKPGDSDVPAAGFWGYSDPEKPASSAGGSHDHPAEKTAIFYEVDSEAEADEDFEFALLSDDTDVAPADEIFLDGRIRAVYPLFDSDLFPLYREEEVGGGGAAAASTERKVVRLPLKKLMFQERDGDANTSACSSPSSDERDELRDIPAESYCLWSPGTSTPPASPGMTRKSRSTGSSSLRWKLRDLVIGRSHSDGRRKLVLLTPATSAPAPAPHQKAPVQHRKTGQNNRSKESGMSTMHRVYYAKGHAAGTGERRRSSYLPYRMDLVGLFGPPSHHGGGGGSHAS